MNVTLLRFVTAFWKSLTDIFIDMSPFILLGLIIAGVLHELLPDNWVSKVAGKRNLATPVLISLIGVPLPLCSCSVIPFAASLRKDGASKGAVSSFLTSTPQTGVDSILAAYGFFGLPFALFKVAAAFVSGTLSGWMVDLFSRREEKMPARVTTVLGQTGPVDCSEDDSHCHGDSCCSRGAVAGDDEDGTISVGRRLRSMADYAFFDLFGDFAAIFLIGILASAVLAAAVPPDLLGNFEHIWLYYPAILLLSIPLYVCATASLPIAFALMQTGVPPGAAMILLIAGPATNIATLGVVAKSLGKRGTVIYVCTIVVSAVVGGILFDVLIQSGTMSADVQPAEIGFPRVFGIICAVLLAGGLVFHVVRNIMNRLRRRHSSP